MQLRNARLCLDCEEVHDAQQCPLCTSEAYVPLTRWVEAPERRTRTSSERKIEANSGCIRLCLVVPLDSVHLIDVLSVVGKSRGTGIVTAPVAAHSVPRWSRTM